MFIKNYHKSITNIFIYQRPNKIVMFLAKTIQFLDKVYRQISLKTATVCCCQCLLSLRLRFCIQPLSRTYAQPLGILNCIKKLQKASQLHQRSYGHLRVPNGLEKREGSKRRGGLCCQIKAKGVRALRTRKWAACASGAWQAAWARLSWRSRTPS